MKAEVTINELRVGNLLKDPILTIEVTAKLLLAFEENEEYIKLYRPIPLSEEWLLNHTDFKLHPSSNVHWNFYKLPSGWYISFAKHTELSAGVEKGNFYYGETYIKISTVHLLQNIHYYRNNFEELTIKTK